MHAYLTKVVSNNSTLEIFINFSANQGCQIDSNFQAAGQTDAENAFMFYSCRENSISKKMGKMMKLWL